MLTPNSDIDEISTRDIRSRDTPIHNLVIFFFLGAQFSYLKRTITFFLFLQ